MNTNNENISEPVQPVKKGRGRPANPDSAAHFHFININPETKQAFGKGRLRDGTKILRVKINKSIKCADFIWGTTPVIESHELVIGNPQIPAASNVNVTVIEPPSEVVESAPVQAAVEIPA